MTLYRLRHPLPAPMAPPLRRGWPVDGHMAQSASSAVSAADYIIWAILGASIAMVAWSVVLDIQTAKIRAREPPYSTAR